MPMLAGDLLFWTTTEYALCSRCGIYYAIGCWPYCPHGEVSTKNAAIHASERVVVNYNPRTQEVRIPGRADRPIDPKYAAAGYERRELGSLAEVRKLEKAEGLVHEASNYDRNGNETNRP